MINPTHPELIMTSWHDDLDILLVSQLLPVNAFRLSASNELEAVSPPVDLQTFFDLKHTEYSPYDTKSMFKIYGAIPSPNNTVINFLYE
jgi:hypothetical protein